MNATAGTLTATLARIPILGYVLKVVHDLLKLPVLRADLHSEFLDLAERSDRQEAGLRKVGERIDRIQAGIEEEIRGQETARVGELRELQSRMNAQEETFAEVLRRHGRALAVLQESIAGHAAACQVPLDAFAGLVDMVKSLQAELRPEMQSWHASAERSEPEATGRPLFEPASSLRSEVRLNLGGGARPVRFCLQVAPNGSPDADVIADPGELPFLPASIAGIYADHLLESCSAKESRRLLSHWSGLLRPEGTLHLNITDLESAARSFASASSSFEDLTRAILGRNGVRQNAFSREALHRVLEESGFHPVAEEPVEDASARGFKFEIHATKAVRQFIPRRTRSIASA